MCGGSFPGSESMVASDITGYAGPPESPHKPPTPVFEVHVTLVASALFASWLVACSTVDSNGARQRYDHSLELMTP